MYKPENLILFYAVVLKFYINTVRITQSELKLQISQEYTALLSGVHCYLSHVLCKPYGPRDKYA